MGVTITPTPMGLPTTTAALDTHSILPQAASPTSPLVGRSKRLRWVIFIVLLDICVNRIPVDGVLDVIVIFCTRFSLPQYTRAFQVSFCDPD